MFRTDEDFYGDSCEFINANGKDFDDSENLADNEECLLEGFLDDLTKDLEIDEIKFDDDDFYFID